MIARATGSTRSAPPRLGRALPALVATLVALAGCQSTKEPAAATPAPPGGGNVEAKLYGTGGSVAGGSAVMHQVRGGVDMSLWLGSVGPGEYRVAIHERGNCTSPNAFSAGAPWAPPGVPVAVVLFNKNDDTRTIVLHFPGYQVFGPDGIGGRAVVVHSGSRGPVEAEPGVKNDRIACGAIGTPERLFPGLNF